MKPQIFTLKTERQGYYDITRTVREAVRESGIQSGIAVVFCPHTTGAITINENADPDVKHDLTLGLDAAFPDRAAFRHAEGNSDAHLKCSTVGASETILIEERLHLSRLFAMIKKNKDNAARLSRTLMPGLCDAA